MNVLIVSFYYNPELGAAPSRITNLALGLKSKSVEVDILTCLPNYPKGRIFEGYRNRFSYKEVIDDIRIFRFWTYASVSRSAVSRILSMTSFAMTLWRFAFRREQIKKYDAVIIQSPPILVAWSALLLFKKIYSKKIILNISDLWPLSAVELGAINEGSTFHKVLSRMEQFLYSNADGVMGQSEEILDHIKSFYPLKNYFLYRNLQHAVPVDVSQKVKEDKFRIVYAGLLGVAQDILTLIKSIDFKKIDVELHLYGGGNQASEIEKYITSNDAAIYYHGYLEKNEMVKTLVRYNASIVPLAVRIKGAVPSKIFDLLPVGVPVLFCGGGEGASIVTKNKLGYVSDPGNYDQLKNNIIKLKNLSLEAYQQMTDNCIYASRNEFDFEKQLEKYISFLKTK